MPILREDDNWPSVKKSQHPIKDILKYALIIGLVWLAHELFKDYCFEQHRKLTDKEYLTIAFNDLLKSGDMKIHDWDNTIDTYLLHHPGCCRIRKDYGLLSPITTEIIVEIVYEKIEEARRRINELEKNTHYHSYIIMTDCGRPYVHSGEAIPTPTSDFIQQNIN